VKPPEFSPGIIWSYLVDTQFVLLVIAAGWTVLMLRSGAESAPRRLAVLTGANLLVNVAFFMTHPVFTPYYTIPISMLSLWSLLFAALKQPEQAVDSQQVALGARA